MKECKLKEKTVDNIKIMLVHLIIEALNENFDFEIKKKKIDSEDIITIWDKEKQKNIYLYLDEKVFLSDLNEFQEYYERYVKTNEDKNEN